MPFGRRGRIAAQYARRAALDASRSAGVNESRTLQKRPTGSPWGNSTFTCLIVERQIRNDVRTRSVHRQFHAQKSDHSLALALLAAAGCSNNDATTAPNNGTFVHDQPLLDQRHPAAQRRPDGSSSIAAMAARRSRSPAMVRAISWSLSSPTRSRSERVRAIPRELGNRRSAALQHARAHEPVRFADSTTSLSSTDALAIRTSAREAARVRSNASRARARQQLDNAGKWSRSTRSPRAVSADASVSATTIPSVGSVRPFPGALE